MSVGFDVAANSGGSSATTLTITPGAAGNAIYVLAATISGALTSVSDDKNAGNYTANGSPITNGATTMQWFRHLNCTNALTTVTLVQTGSGSSMVAYSLSGVAASSDINDTQSSTTNFGGGTGSIPSVTVGSTGSAILAGWGDSTLASSALFTAIAPWTTTAPELASFLPLQGQTQTGVSAGTSTVTCTESQSGGTATVGIAIVINPASGAATIFMLGHT